MPKLLQRQPAYKLFLSAPGKTRVDATSFVWGDVSLSVDQNLISTLTFKLLNPDIHNEYLRMGYSIYFYGGEAQGSNFYKKDSLDGSNFKYLFGGEVRFIKSNYTDAGVSYITITGIDNSWKRTAYTNNYFAYPSDNCLRGWASNKNSLKLSEIVEGIVVTELGMGLNLELEKDSTYFDFSPAVQHDKSDWAFLRLLAHWNSCYVWTSHTEGNSTINFVDKSKVVHTPGRYEFVYLARDKKGFVQGSYLPEGDGVSEHSKLAPHQIEILKVTIEENPQITGMNTTVVSSFDEATGETKELLVSYDETKEEIIYYELDQAKINKMEKTAEGSKILDKILALGPMDIPPEVFMNFYIPVKIQKHQFKALDTPFLGITLRAKIRGNVNIDPFQSYVINGISRYATKSKTSKYYLKSIEYTFGSEGFLMDLEFIR